MMAPRLVLQRVMVRDVGEGGGTRKRRRHVKWSDYLQGMCRKLYKLNESLNQSFL